LFIARLFGVICALVYFLVYQKTIIITLKDLFHVDFAIMRKILFVGIPFAAEQMFFNGGKILTQTFIVRLGTHALVINAICNSLSMLLQIGAAGNNLAIITVVGQCVGRGDIKDARKFIRSFLVLGFLFFLVSDIIVLSFLPILVGFFSPPADIVPTVYKIMWISALVSPFLWTTSFTTPSALRAAGDSRFTSVSSMLSMWLFRVVLGYILGVVLPFGIVGVWIAMMCEWGIRGGIFLWRLHGNKWFQHHLVDE
jgi:Na+-driven multidrug efflux pump